MSQSKMDLCGDILSQGVFTLFLAYFCANKKIYKYRQTYTGKHTQKNTYTFLFVPCH